MTASGFARVLLGLGLLLAPTLASASECDRPEAAWLMCEDFEGGAQGWETWFAQSPWTECSGCSDGTNNPDRIRLENDQALVHDGEWALHTPGGEAAGYQGGTLRYATCDGAPQSGCPLRGYDRLYFRTWVRLAADHSYVRHFLGLRGTKPDAYWDANGNAGCRPQGDRWAGTRVDLNSEHELFFYTYHPDMDCDAGGYCSGEYAQNICNGCAGIDMPCNDGLECCWGKHFSPEQPVVLPTETWTCLEMSMELNTPGLADGSMSFWVDDQLGHEATGMRWRDGSDLQLNRALLEHYIEPGNTDQPNQAWFDDVVVSTERIGCGSLPGGTTGGTGTDPTEGGHAGSSGSPPSSSDSTGLSSSGGDTQGSLGPTSPSTTETGTTETGTTETDSSGQNSTNAGCTGCSTPGSSWGGRMGALLLLAGLFMLRGRNGGR